MAINLRHLDAALVEHEIFPCQRRSRSGTSDSIKSEVQKNPAAIERRDTVNSDSKNSLFLGVIHNGETVADRSGIVHRVNHRLNHRRIILEIELIGGNIPICRSLYGNRYDYI